MICVPLDDELIRKACDMDATVRAKYAKRPKKNYTGFHHPDRFLHGFIGELAFERLCETWQLRYFSDRRVDAIPDDGEDTILFHYGSPSGVDVKCTASPNARLIRIPTEQKSEPHFIAACNLVKANRRVFFRGMVQPKQLADLATLRREKDGIKPEAYYDAYWLPFSQLSYEMPMLGEWYDRVDDNQASC